MLFLDAGIENMDEPRSFKEFVLDKMADTRGPPPPPPSAPTIPPMMAPYPPHAIQPAFNFRSMPPWRNPVRNTSTFEECASYRREVDAKKVDDSHYFEQKTYFPRKNYFPQKKKQLEGGSMSFKRPYSPSYPRLTSPSFFNDDGDSEFDRVRAKRLRRWQDEDMAEGDARTSSYFDSELDKLIDEEREDSNYAPKRSTIPRSPSSVWKWQPWTYSPPPIPDSNHAPKRPGIPCSPSSFSEHSPPPIRAPMPTMVQPEDKWRQYSPPALSGQLISDFGSARPPRFPKPGAYGQPLYQSRYLPPRAPTDPSRTTHQLRSPFSFSTHQPPSPYQPPPPFSTHQPRSTFKFHHNPNYYGTSIESRVHRPVHITGKSDHKAEIDDWDEETSVGDNGYRDILRVAASPGTHAAVGIYSDEDDEEECDEAFDNDGSSSTDPHMMTGISFNGDDDASVTSNVSNGEEDKTAEDNTPTSAAIATEEKQPQKRMAQREQDINLSPQIPPPPQAQTQSSAPETRGPDHAVSGDEVSGSSQAVDTEDPASSVPSATSTTSSTDTSIHPSFYATALSTSWPARLKGMHDALYMWDAEIKAMKEKLNPNTTLAPDTTPDIPDIFWRDFYQRQRAWMVREMATDFLTATGSNDKGSIAAYIKAIKDSGDETIAAAAAGLLDRFKDDDVCLDPQDDEDDEGDDIDLDYQDSDGSSDSDSDQSSVTLEGDSDSESEQYERGSELNHSLDGDDADDEDEVEQLRPVMEPLSPVARSRRNSPVGIFMQEASPRADKKEKGPAIKINYNHRSTPQAKPRPPLNQVIVISDNEDISQPPTPRQFIVISDSESDCESVTSEGLYIHTTSVMEEPWIPDEMDQQASRKDQRCTGEEMSSEGEDNDEVPRKDQRYRDPDMISEGGKDDQALRKNQRYGDKDMSSEGEDDVASRSGNPAVNNSFSDDEDEEPRNISEYSPPRRPLRPSPRTPGEQDPEEESFAHGHRGDSEYDEDDICERDEANLNEREIHIYEGFTGFDEEEDQVERESEYRDGRDPLFGDEATWQYGRNTSGPEAWEYESDHLDDTEEDDMEVDDEVNGEVDDEVDEGYGGTYGEYEDGNDEVEFGRYVGYGWEIGHGNSKHLPERGVPDDEGLDYIL